MQLTEHQQRMLSGEHGPAVRKSMEILVAVGEIYGAQRMLPVESVHLTGASIVATGEAGVEFVEEMARSVERLAVPATLNPGSLDRMKWAEMELEEDRPELQKRLSAAYEKMGTRCTHTCTPYVVGNAPKRGEHVAWGESSAVIFANSVLGARTNREGGPTALASAITGLTPEWGYHLDENRKGHLLVDVRVPMSSAFDYGNLGFHVGKIAKDRIPVFTGLPRDITQDQHKILGATLASSGAVAMYHVVGVTPEAPTLEAAFGGRDPEETHVVDAAAMGEASGRLNKAPGQGVDWIYLGCPHLSLDELERVASFLDGKRVEEHVALWVSSSFIVNDDARQLGYTQRIEAAGGHVISGTCPVLALSDVIAQRKGYESITTNSAKMANYMPGQFNIRTRYGSLEQCLEAALTGRWAVA